jgi:glucosamine--fructose-6-phosphate aminotransferase (isomerizing)
MAAEMAEQPERLADLVARWEPIATSVRELAPVPMAGTIIAARGSSDHAGAFGRYLLELVSKRPVSMAAPSLHTLYRAGIDCRGYLAIAVSQSGRTPEIVTTLERMRAGGAQALAITSDPGSPLSAAADRVIELGTGVERAVPATKTVTATMTAFALVAAALGAVPFTQADVTALPRTVADVLADPEPPERMAAELAGSPRLLTVARGLMLGAALEAALKLKETTMTAVEGFSAADLRHGPIAVVEPGLPVLAFVSDGPARTEMEELVKELRARGARVLEVGPSPAAELPLPEGLPEALSPIVAVVRAQQLALALALRRGVDPDAPGDLTKVTAT